MRQISCLTEGVHLVQLWGGLLVFCGFIVWDTQMIIEKKRRGDGDFIGHSLDLFIDFMQVFRKVLILLMQKVLTILHNFKPN